MRRTLLAAGAAAVALALAAGLAARDRPQRLDVPPGEGGAAIEGRLAAGDADRFLVAAEPGQRLTVVMEESAGVPPARILAPGGEDRTAVFSEDGVEATWAPVNQRGDWTVAVATLPGGSGTYRYRVTLTEAP